MSNQIQINTQEACGIALDWGVALALGKNPEVLSGSIICNSDITHAKLPIPIWSSDWHACGKLIDDEKIQVRYVDDPNNSMHGLWLSQYCKFRSSSSSVDWTKAGRFSAAKLYKGFNSGHTIQTSVCRSVINWHIGQSFELPESVFKIMTKGKLVPINPMQNQARRSGDQS